MAVMLPREKWTDDRLDDFKGYVTERFDRVDTDIRELRRTVNYGIAVMITGFLSLAGLIVF